MCPTSSPPSRWRLVIGDDPAAVNIVYEHDELGETVTGTLYLGPDEVEDLRKRLA